MAQVLLDVALPGVFFEVAVHVATLVSVLLVYRERVVRLVRGGVRGEAESWRYLLLLGLATVPAAVVGVGFREVVERAFDSPVVPGVALLVTGSLLFSTRWVETRGGEVPESPPPAPAPPGLRAALFMGIAQAFALVPGISRSGSTVVVGLWMGVEAREAAAFSFLMAVPAIAGAALLQIPELVASGPGVAGPVLAGGAGVAAVTGVLAIRTFVVMLRKRAFHRFAWYCWGVGGAFLVYLGLQ
jgi:undecaprenyl-diphosphatase